MLLRDKFTDTKGADAKRKVRAELGQYFDDLKVLKKRECPMTNGPPTYDEVVTLFGSNGPNRKAEAVRGMYLLLNSKHFRHPAEFAEVWSLYRKAAEEIVNLSKEEVSLICSSLINSLGREDKGRAPRIAQGPAC